MTQETPKGLLDQTGNSRSRSVDLKTTVRNAVTPDMGISTQTDLEGGWIKPLGVDGVDMVNSTGGGKTGHSPGFTIWSKITSHKVEYGKYYRSCLAVAIIIMLYLLTQGLFTDGHVTIKLYPAITLTSRCERNISVCPDFDKWRTTMIIACSGYTAVMHCLHHKWERRAIVTLQRPWDPGRASWEGEYNHKEDPTPITIYQLVSGSMYSVPISVEDQEIQAVVDTAAEVTIISDRLYHGLADRPPVIKVTTMQTAGREMGMKAYQVGPVTSQLGTTQFTENVYVAPIGDDMLFGADSMRSRLIVLDMLNNRLMFDDETVPMVFGRKGNFGGVAKVTLQGRTTTPPNSVVRAPCHLSQTLGEYMIEPILELQVIMPRTVHEGGQQPKVCFVNPTEVPITLRGSRRPPDPDTTALSGSDAMPTNGPDMTLSADPDTGTGPDQRNKDSTSLEDTEAMTSVRETRSSRQGEQFDECPTWPWDPGGISWDGEYNYMEDPMATTAFHTHADIEHIWDSEHATLKVYIVTRSSEQTEGTAIPMGTANDIKEAQQNDPELQYVYEWAYSRTGPSEGELKLSSPATKHYWINREMFFITEGVLWREGNEEGEKRLVIPASMKSEVIDLNHSIPSAGHQGVQRTLSRIKLRYYWHRMSDDVRNFIAGCPKCNKNKKPRQYSKFEIVKFHAGSPMERVHLDFLGPLPKTKNILMMVDQFTKWVECIPLPSQEAEVTAQAAVNEFFARFGCPFEVFTDQGRNFESQLFTAVCDLLHIHKRRTTPYRSSANGQVERYNRTLMNAVRCYVGNSQNDWDINLPQIAAAMRVSVNRSTGYTANRLMLGREVNLPSELMYSQPSASSAEDLGQYVQNLEQTLKTTHNIARKTLKTDQERMKRDYDLRINTKAYDLGDCVYILDTATIKGKCRKLSPPWKGPGIVVEKLTPYLYRVKIKRQETVVHHDRMKLCKDSTLPDWIRKYQEAGRRGHRDQSVGQYT
ncbi:uncharacterized protein [Ptychodera flava]|uniref:uncharacterized protein n=1 Tax=Ptychodera flava TaxID=63121 RepID=UPI003969EE9A